MNLNIFAHLANILFLVAYIVKDVLWLRIMSVFGCAALIVYYYAYPAEPLWTTIVWDGIFVVINSVHIAILIREKSGIVLTAEERRLLATTFSAMSPQHFIKLARIGVWKDVEKGHILARQGEPVDSVMLITIGTATVTVDGKIVAAAREERLKMSGNPAQYDDLGIFVAEQELLAELVRESALPRLELDVSDGDVAGAADRICHWYETTGGLHLSGDTVA